VNNAAPRVTIATGIRRCVASSLLLVAATPACAADVACGEGTRVTLDDGRSGTIIAVRVRHEGEVAVRIAFDDDGRRSWHDGRAHAIHPARAPADRCVAPTRDLDAAVSFGPQSQDDDDPPRERTERW